MLMDAAGTRVDVPAWKVSGRGRVSAKLLNVYHAANVHAGSYGRPCRMAAARRLNPEPLHPNRNRETTATTHNTAPLHQLRCCVDPLKPRGRARHLPVTRRRLRLRQQP